MIRVILALIMVACFIVAGAMLLAAVENADYNKHQAEYWYKRYQDEVRKDENRR